MPQLELCLRTAISSFKIKLCVKWGEGVETHDRSRGLSLLGLLLHS